MNIKLIVAILVALAMIVTAKEKGLYFCQDCTGDSDCNTVPVCRPYSLKTCYQTQDCNGPNGYSLFNIKVNKDGSHPTAYVYNFDNESCTGTYTQQAFRCNTCYNEENENTTTRTTQSPPLVEGLIPKKEPIKPEQIPTPTRQFEISNVDESDPLLDPMVKVFSVLTSPNYYTPWQMRPQREVTGSGFIISGRRILTNAHVVSDQTSIMLTKFGNPTKFPAKLISSAHEFDLALLTVENDEFWEGIEPLELGEIPELQDTITVVGFPTGGSNICVTQGVVSRIDLQPYAHSETKLLSIQIDAAINPGNSGGPAIMDGKVVGIAFQNMAGASSVGFIIPTPIINHFLDDVERNGKFTGVPMLGIVSQNLDSIPKAYFNAPAQTSGILVNNVHPLSAIKDIVKVHDIITHIDGIPIADDGSVVFRRRERINFEYLLSNYFVGDTLELSLLRKGEKLNVKVPLVPQYRVVPFQLYDSSPSYFVYSGLVFVPITYPFLMEVTNEELGNAYRRIYERVERITSPDYQVVLLSQILFDKINHGYSSYGYTEVKKVNGIPVQNLKHLVELIEHYNANADYIIINLEHDSVIVLDTKEATQANSRILAQHAIPHMKSKDLRLLDSPKKE
eukprot:gene9066-11104_t